MHVDMDPKSTLENAHAIAMRVEEAVCREVPAARLEIHMDPGTTPHTHTHVGTPVDDDEEDKDEPDDHEHGHNHNHH
jgi:divalent metal cation (Fe/Co/Zn/Cd) transporter